MAGKAKFYLKKPDASGKSLIYLKFKFGGQRLVFSTGHSIRPEFWDAKRGCIKRLKQTESDGSYRLNDLQAKLALECEAAYNEQSSRGKPSVEGIKDRLRVFMGGDKTEKHKGGLYGLIDRFISGEITYKKGTKQSSTLKVYRTTKHHLEEFEAKYKFKVNFDKIGIDLYYRYVAFIKAKGLSPNSIGKDIKNIKVFMREALEMELTDNLQFEKPKFSVTKEDTSATFLTTGEISKLYKYDLSGNTRLEPVRDLFVFGCSVGLRFSDYSNIKPENIREMDGETYIDLKAQKTNQRVVIPCNPIVKDIFAKYRQMPNSLPRAISNQKFNSYIKEACKLAGLNAKGRLEGAPDKELWETVSSHTARRSFATNLYNEGFPIIDLMKITGHKTEKAFLGYIKINETDAAKRLSRNNKGRNWSEFILKVAS